MFNWLRACFSRNTIENSSQLRGLKKYLSDPVLWDLNRKSVARGVAVGLFAAIIPLMPFQMVLAVIIAILVRANLMFAVALCWINNPITLLPIAYFVSAVGRLILGEEQNQVQLIIKEFAWKLGLTDQSLFTSWIAQFGKEYFVGLPVVAVGLAFAGYLLVVIIWYIYQFIKKK